MAEDLQENLATYNLQLQQVEATLTNDPGNEDLIKLKRDLEEVINLTLELLSQNAKTKKSATGTTPGATSDGSFAQSIGESTQAQSGQLVTEKQSTTTHDWKVGDDCLALWSTDGQHYPAVVEEILENGSCTVTFQEYGNSDLTQVHLLKKVEEKSDSGDGTAGGKPKSKKDLVAQHREYKRKKQQKKAQRQKQQTEERETEKNKWLSFNSKTLTKMSKGKVKKSIFATTDTVQGRVGVGTCGTSGRPMTNYHQQEKWKKS